MKTTVFFSPSTNRVCTPYQAGMTATLQLNDNFEPEGGPIHKAPIGPDKLSKSFSNQHITDWERREIKTWDEL